MLAVGTIILLTGTAILGVAHIVNILLGAVIFRRRRKGEPQIVKGHFLWGSGEEFSHHAVEFLHRTQKTYGDVFTIRLVNKYLTIIMDPHSIDAVSQEKNFDFDPIQKQVNNNVFDFKIRNSHEMIKATGKTVRGVFLDRSMRSFASNLDNSCKTVMDKGHDVADGWKEEGLRMFTSATMFDAIFTTIFGNKHHPVFNPAKVYKNFEAFHHYFNLLWLGFPSYMFPATGKVVAELRDQPTAEELLSRMDSSDYLKTSIEFMKQNDHTERDIQGHNLVYLHVNYTTFRLAFWVLVNILENPKVHKLVKEEINNFVDQHLDEDTNTAQYTPKEIESLQILDSICQESIRLSSGVFMVRYVAKDTIFHTVNDGTEYMMREGDRIAIYPPALHKDPEIFENPQEFKYDRFIDAKFYKNGKVVKHPVPAFGTLCPGQRFAMLQLKWYIIRMITAFELELRSDFKAELATEYHGHEILPPRKDINVAYRPIPNAPILLWEKE